MAKKFILLFNRVLIEKVVAPTKIVGDILLPESTSKLNSGKVIAVGAGSRGKDGNTIPVSVKEGDHVLLPEYGGTEVKLAEKEYHLYGDDDIACRFGVKEILQSVVVAVDEWRWSEGIIVLCKEGRLVLYCQ